MTPITSVAHASALSQRFAGCLLGGAVGDAVGLAVENIGPRRAEKLFPDLDGPRLLGRRGMVSDDTEHALFTAHALLLSGDDVEKFALNLQRELKFWLLGLPAGAGAATLKAALRSWRGASPDVCGVDSAGNGPAMRAPIIGLWARSDDAVCHLNRASARLTHLDPRAEIGALCVALAARDAAHHISPQESVAHIESTVRAWAASSTWGTTSTWDEGTESLLRDVTRASRASRAAREGVQCWDFAREIVGDNFEKKGVSGFIAHTVPLALHAAWRAGDDVREAVLGAVRCGGDTDSTGAIAGAISGARAGSPGVPRDWTQALLEWPRGVNFIEQAAISLAAAREENSPSTSGAADDLEAPQVLPQVLGAGLEAWPHAIFPAVLARNLFFGAVVLAHGLRRLAPPY